MKRELLSDPEKFREMLRKVVRKTWPIVAASSLAVGCGQSITILPADYESQAQVDGGGEVVPDTTLANDTSRPEINPNLDFRNIPQENRLDACPVEQCGPGSSEWNKQAEGRYLRLLAPVDPRPLSFNQCVQLCKTDLEKVCSNGGNGEYSTYYNLAVTGCKEEYDRNQQRGLVCDYTVKRSCAVAGRRPAGMQEKDPTENPPPGNDLAEAGAFFAELAYLEEAAVTAFRYLTQELEAYNAPEALLALSRQAIQEEVEHAQLMTQLAHRYGATTQPVQVEPFELRPLAEIAFENAKEGCIREAYGSLMAFWQSETAEDPAVRAVMERIAHEESAHAALSFAIDAWIQPQLSEPERQQYKAYQQESYTQLQQELAEDPSPALVRWAGYPPKDVGMQLFRSLQHEVAA